MRFINEDDHNRLQMMRDRLLVLEGILVGFIEIGGLMY